MKLVVISPEHDEPRERAVLGELFAAGLERYHVRKPDWSREKLETWLRALPAEWRARVVVHTHHELVAPLGLRGVHFRDENPVGCELARAAGVPASGRPTQTNRSFISRSCHDLATLRVAFGRYDSVFFGPVFPSLSKPGYGPSEKFSAAAISSLLVARTAADRRTTVLALGGITAETAPRALALGFDGVAVLGAIWQAVDPVRALTELQSSLVCHAA
jgi:thiamine-phosphate pyrophosphorylase